MAVLLAGSMPATAGQACTDDPGALYGLWEIRLWHPDSAQEPPVARGVMLLGQHPEYPGSVRGALRLASQTGEEQAQVAGDLNDGVFLLDESDDGRRIRAVWEGLAPSCEHTIEGQRRLTAPQSGSPTALRFLLIKRAD